MKFFIVVGSQIPFDRLVGMIDTWAGSQKGHTFFGQIGESKLHPKNIDYVSKMSAKEFHDKFMDCDIIISHAGMGVILKAMENNKPIIVLPRQVVLNECTTDHQLATARALKKLDYVNVAMTDEDLLQYLKVPHNVQSLHTITKYASDQLIHTISDFIAKV